MTEHSTPLQLGLAYAAEYAAAAAVAEDGNCIASDAIILAVDYALAQAAAQGIHLTAAEATAIEHALITAATEAVA